MSAPLRLRGDRGAAMVETALVSPVFLLLVFGVLEFGLAFRDDLSVGDAVSDAARVGAIQGPDVTPEGYTADFSIVNAVRMGLAGLDPQKVEKIVVFKAGPASAGSAIDQVPEACRTGVSSTSAQCNVYDPILSFIAIQDGDAEYFRCLRVGDPACGWNPTGRRDGPLVSDIEYLGVYVRYRHDYVTGLFGSSFLVEDASIARLEPGDLSG